MSLKLGMRTLAVALLIVVLAPSLALAAGLPMQIVPQDCNTNPGGCSSICDLAQLAQNVLNAAIYLAVVLSAVLFAWAGFLYLTNVANSGQHSRAVETFTNVAIGLTIIVAGWLVIDITMRAFLGASLLPWNNIC
jgi:cytochrome bd-type quinol oxidase subunit 2